MFKNIKQIIINHKISSPIVAVLSIFFIFILFIYLQLFKSAHTPEKLSSLSTIMSFFLGQIFSIIYIIYQLKGNMKNSIHNKKYDVINENSENIMEIINNIDTIIDIKAHLGLELNRLQHIDNHERLADNFTDNFNNFLILYPSYYEKINDTLDLCAKTENKFRSYDINNVENILNLLNKIKKSLSSVKQSKCLSDFYLNTIKYDKNNNYKNCEQPLQMAFTNMSFETDISKLRNELYHQIKHLNEIKESNSF